MARSHGFRSAFAWHQKLKSASSNASATESRTSFAKASPPPREATHHRAEQVTSAGTAVVICCALDRARDPCDCSTAAFMTVRKIVPNPSFRSTPSSRLVRLTKEETAFFSRAWQELRAPSAMEGRERAAKETPKMLAAVMAMLRWTGVIVIGFD